MRILSNTDFIEVSVNSLVADYDYETMVNLYQPIIGYMAMSVYFTLLFEGKNQKVYSLAKHEDVLERMQLATGDFVNARNKLEAVGLLKTFYLKEQDTVIYHYEVYAPRTPNEFFDNALLYGMLIKCIGEENAKKIKLLYPNQGSKDYGEDISSKFTDVFTPEFDDKAFATALTDTNNAKGRNHASIKGSFSYEVFFNELKEISQISEKSISKKEMKEIYRLATLYGVDENVAANHVANVFDPTASQGNHIDLNQLNKLFQREGDYNVSIKKSNKPNTVSGNSALAQKINLMETFPPKKYLSALQNGTKPASADLKLIDDLSRNYGLSNGVINCLIDYVLGVCDNILSRAFAEKVAASIAREGIETAVDAMNYLIKVNNKKKGSSSNKKTNPYRRNDEEEITNEVTTSQNSGEKNKQTSVDDPSWDELLDEIDQGGSDGKA